MNKIIHIVAPSNTMADLPEPMKQIGIKRLEGLGFIPRISQSAQHRYLHVSGTAIERLTDLLNAFADPDACGVMAVFGGYNSNDLLEGLDKLICSTPKWFIGYSDVTALLLPLSRHPMLNVIHGPSFASFCDPNFFPFSQNAFLAAVSKQESCFVSPNIFASDPWYTKSNYGPRETHIPCAWQVYQRGEIAAKIIGGNVDTFCALLGTPYFPEVNNKILFLEAATGQPGPFQRSLVQLKYAGVFRKISGLAIGAFPANSPLQNTGYISTILQMLDLPDYPVVYNIHCSHVDPMLSIPLNRPAKLSALENPALTIHYSSETPCA